MGLRVVEFILRTHGWSACTLPLAPCEDDPAPVAAFIGACDPTAVLFDIPYPYAEAWSFFARVRQSEACASRRFVLTTTAPALTPPWATADPTLAVVEVPFGYQELVQMLEALVANRHSIAMR
jgi:hypothetical protein